MRLQEIMSTDVVTIGPDESAENAWLRMQRKRIRHLLVVEGGRLVGVLSERDLGGRNGSQLRKARTVRELMTAQTATATPTTTLRQAANLMRGRLIGSLPVLDDGKIVGIVTATDVLEELGRGSSRPAVRAQRQSMRMPPASARQATAKRTSAAKRRQRAARSAKRASKAASDSGGGRDGAVGKRSASISPKLTRKRRPTPDSTKRAPLAAQVPRSQKTRIAAGATPQETPAYIRGAESVIRAADKDYLRIKLGRKLGKFAHAIQRTSVRVDDVNGPRGGVDKRCRIKVVLHGLPSIVVEERQESLQAAMDGALARTERAVRQAVQRRRTRAIRPREREVRVPVYG
jgi:CBS domain-containing protein/ribosome-associated translation inhibitor RaiA